MSTTYNIYGSEFECTNDLDLTDCLVGIICSTYNQSSYIKETIESFLRQKTNFNYHILVIDDASNDGTAEILEKLALEHAEEISLFIAKKNIFKNPLRKQIYREIKRRIEEKVKYIAVCEGDDYWTDENKLQIQVDYLEKNPDCNLYVHNSWWYDCVKEKREAANPYICSDERDLNFEEIILMNNRHPATASFLYKSDLQLCAPEYVFSCSVGDYSLLTYAKSFGKVHYSNRIMCLYRYLSGSSTTDIMASDEGRSYKLFHSLGVAAYLMYLDYHTNFTHHGIINRKIMKFILGLLDYLVDSTITETEVIKAMNPYTLNYDNQLISYFSQILTMLVDEEYLTDGLEKYIRKHKEFYIFGTGVYAKRLLKQVETNGFYPKGFLRTNVSDGEISFKGYKVYPISELIDTKNGEGIVISTLPVINDGIEEVMNAYRIEDYIYAYGINKEEVLHLIDCITDENNKSISN